MVIRINMHKPTWSIINQSLMFGSKRVSSGIFQLWRHTSACAFALSDQGLFQPYTDSLDDEEYINVGQRTYWDNADTLWFLYTVTDTFFPWCDPFCTIHVPLLEQHYQYKIESLISPNFLNSVNKISPKRKWKLHAIKLDLAFLMGVLRSLMITKFYHNAAACHHKPHLYAFENKGSI